MRLRVSVGRRLLLLIGFQTALLMCGVGLTFHALRNSESLAEYMYRYQYMSVQEIGRAIQDTSHLEDLFSPFRTKGVLRLGGDTPAQLLNRIEAFVRNYQTQWNTARSNTEHARSFRKELARENKGQLMEKELTIVQDLETSLDQVKIAWQDQKGSNPTVAWKETVAVRQHLAALLELNAEYSAIAHELVLERIKLTRTLLVFLGLVGTISSVLLGISVHRAIAPRIRRLVHKVHQFRDYGVQEAIMDPGKDEISILANALDAGFAAIATRDQERENFLAIAAHELKTPIASIQGFSSILLTHQDQPALRASALAVINRQAWRASRLIEDLFLATGARRGLLRFQPQPFDLVVLVNRILSEIKTYPSEKEFKLEGPRTLRILGDETLLGHALWSLFTCASALASPRVPISVALRASATYASILIHVAEPLIRTEDFRGLFEPFQTVKYEKENEIRGPIGLYLCREIARIHCGSLQIENPSGDGPILRMDLPA